MSISVIILSFNGEDVLEATLRAAARVSDDLHVVDSYSTDRTAEIAARHGVNFVQHAFTDYGSQRRWASQHLPLKHDWELHLDQDNVMTDELVDEINRLKASFPDGINGYYIGRLMYFMGRPIRHGGMFPNWQMRLFRRGMGTCENRRYDTHFWVEGRKAHLKGVMTDEQAMTVSEWTARHNRWASAEASEIVSPTTEGVIAGRIRGDIVERKRALRGFYNRWPLFVRPFLLFFYRYFIRLGFLDGREGLVFFVLQTFWWRFLIDANILEQRLLEKRPADQPSQARALSSVGEGKS